MKVEDLAADGDWGPGIGEQELARVEKALQLSLPPDYVEFLRRHNGGEGFVGGNYLILFGAEELLPFNQEYEVEEYAPGLLLFGSNGGGEGYAFDTRAAEMPVVRVPFIGMDLRYAKPVASGFSDLFRSLAE